MKTYTKCHLQALSDVIEIGLIASVIALIGDMAWLMHDIHSNGISMMYCSVGTVFIIGLCLTSLALYKHHNNTVESYLKSLLALKLFKQKHINKHRKGLLP